MSNHPALDAQYQKVINGRYTTKRDGSPMHCGACAQPLVAGATLAATKGDGWHSYCTSCAASFPAFIRGLFTRVNTLSEGQPVDVHAVEAVKAVIADPESVPAFLGAVAALNAARAAIGQARRSAPQAGGLDLSHVPSGTYAVPGGDTRLKVKIDNVTKAGRWQGFVFVKDAAVYGQEQRYGMQKPGGTYKGKIEAELRIIAADIAAAAAAYGHLTGRCTFCGLPLEDERSVSRGYGPTCATNHGLPWG